MASAGTYNFTPVKGLLHFLKDDACQQIATHYAISRKLNGLPVYDHHFLLEKVSCYLQQGQKKRVVVKIIHKAEDDNPARTPPQLGYCNSRVKKDIFDFVCNDDGKVLEMTGEDPAGYITSLCSGEWKMVAEGVGYPTTDEERDDAILRAERRLGETDYNLYKNCEFFVTEVLTGTGQSKQFKNVATYAAGSASAGASAGYMSIASI